ncbi:response regulator receiver protein [Caldicellulosiruptor kronotskyensis 2002]|uniref:Response regulator receiver protein n=1 Tax=Caldicellulosiruptor kronotskyensis (strain DSM 18902 / VKM B-2412 / 2002) TaxID=632348 RepID=E4SB55_CALK2|nr:response regulator [Caldicellulosiruptor kronotskyensis]ADQ45710.1 response regulator receiver protein [Caldicellulosiruptor kronotskyensis 2002]
MKILIVDDAVFIRKVLRGILQELGEEVVGEASSGNEALRMVKEYRPDVVTLDITLPDMSGLELLKKIKEISSSTQVVMITAISNHEVVKEAMKVGATNYITKPFSREKVEEVLKKVEKNIQALSQIEKNMTDEKSISQNELSQARVETLGVENESKNEEVAKIDKLVKVESEESKSKIDTTEILNISELTQDLSEKRNETNNQQEISEKVSDLIETEVGVSDEFLEDEKEGSTTAVFYDEDKGEELEVGVVTNIEFEQKGGEDILSICINKELAYNVGRMKLGNGIIVTLEECFVLSSVKHEYIFENSLIEKVEVKEINENAYVMIFTKAKKFDIREREGKISIVFKKSKGVISYNKNNKFIMIDNVLPSNIQVDTVSEKEYIIRISTKDVVYNEGETKVEDLIVDRYTVEKSANGYDVKIVLYKEARYEIIEGRTSVGIKFVEVNILKDVVVHHSEQETLIELVTNSNNVPVVLEHDAENGVAYVYLQGYNVSKSLLEKNFEFEEEYLESLKIVEEREKGQSYLVIYSPVKRISVVKEKGKTFISIKPKKAFILYNVFQECIVFQNILPEEIEINHNQIQNTIEFQVNNKYVILLKDPILDKEEYNTFSSIKVEKTGMKYIGTIVLKSKSKIEVALSNDKNSTNLFVIPYKKLNKIKAFEYEGSGPKTFLTLKGEGEIKYIAERDKEKGAVTIRVLTASLCNIEQPIVEFREGCIERIEFYEQEEDVVINVYSKAEDFDVRLENSDIIVEFEAQVVTFTPVIEDYMVVFELPLINYDDIDIEKNEENNMLVVKVNRRDIYIEKGIKYLQTGIVKRYQVVQENGYKLLIDTTDEIRYSLERKENNVLFVIEKCPVLEKVEVNEQSDELVHVSLYFNRGGIKPQKIEKIDGRLEILLGEVLTKDKNIVWNTESRRIVRNIDYIINEKVLVLSIEHAYALWQIIAENNVIKLTFEVKHCEILIEDEYIKIQNVESDKVQVLKFEDNGLLIVIVPQNAAFLTSNSIKFNSENVLYTAVEQDINQTVWKIYVLYKLNMTFESEISNNDVIIKVNTKRNDFVGRELEAERN